VELTKPLPSVLRRCVWRKRVNRASFGEAERVKAGQIGHFLRRQGEERRGEKL